MKQRTLIISLLVLGGLGGNLAPAEQPDSSFLPGRNGPVFETDGNRLNSVGTSGDLKKLRETIKELEATWHHADQEGYVQLMSMASWWISRSIEDAQSATLAGEYALLAANRVDNVPVEAAFNSLLRARQALELRPSGLTDDAWMARRLAISQKWKTTLERADATLDPNFDPGSVPGLNVKPPVETGLLPGVSPEFVRDLGLRATYEAALAQNNLLHQRYSEQKTLRRDYDRFVKTAGNALAKSYATPPYAVNELHDLLQNYTGNPETKLKLRDNLLKLLPAAYTDALMSVTTNDTGGFRLQTANLPGGKTPGQKALEFARARAAKGKAQSSEKEGIPAQKNPSTGTTVQATVAADQGSDSGLKIWLAVTGVAAIAGWLLLRQRARTSRR